MKSLFATCVGFVFFVVFALCARAADVAVVLSSDAAAYQEALEGFREVVRHRIVAVQTLKSDPANWRDEVRRLRSVIEPDLVFVIGTPALQAVAGELANIPIVHAMVFNPFSISPGTGKNIIGISMNPSAAQVTSLVRELNPKFRRIGTILDPSRSGPLLLEARSLFQKEGLQLLAKEIRSPADIGGALKSLENEIDILWLWPDEMFLTAQILERIFLFSFAQKVPVLGLSERHTDMGALVSLSYGSAKDLGRQAGATVNRLPESDKPMPVPQVTPRHLKLTVNFKTARKLEIKIPDTIVNRADNVVKAPVYRDEDWWVFRIKIIDGNGATMTEVHRVTFNKGRFESEDPSFLTGGDVAGTPVFLPFASVYVNDPKRKWLDFPLVPEKTWSFRYQRKTIPRFRGGRPVTASTEAHAKVIGKVPHLIPTPAGQFEVVEIWRREYVGEDAELTYFYSSQSQSVVKLRAEIRGEHAQQFELELIAYGNGGNMGKDVR
jgi:putative ABC transport system substrate-binding protein